MSPTDDDGGDEEGVTAAEYNKWLTLESKWESAEQTRHEYMEGSQLRKSRDERHRERGMERQAASIEQMKHAKGKVDEHKQLNLAQGKVRDCHCTAERSGCVHSLTMRVLLSWWWHRRCVTR